MELAATAASDLDPSLVKNLVAAAKEADTHEDFMEAAMNIAGVAGERAAEKAVLSSKPGSIWAIHG